MGQIADMEGTDDVCEIEDGGNGIISMNKRQSKIVMSEPNRIEFQGITGEEWSDLIKACSTK